MSQKSKLSMSLGGLALMAVLFIALTIVVSIVFRGARVDLTEGGLYSVSEGTENILENLQEPINLYLYFSASSSEAVPFLTPYATRVREMLEEFVAASDGQLNLEVIDPLPFSEAEDEASGYGLQALPYGPAGDNLFFGLVGTNALDDVETIPFFDPSKEAFLEYDLAKLVYSLATPDKPVIGLISELPIARGFDPATRQMREPWVVATQLEQQFEVRNVPVSTTEIEADIALLVLVHPKSLSEATQYAIDQFVMRGGNLIVFVDPHAEIEQPPQQMDPQQAMFADRSSDLPRLFEAWGIAYDKSKVVLDGINGLQISGGPGRRAVRHIGYLNLTSEYMNADDVTLANLDSINLGLSGHLARAADAPWTFTPLLSSSAESAAVDVNRVKFLPDPGMLLNDFVPGPDAVVLAARFEGATTSAFPDGPPAAEEGEEAQSAEGHLTEADNANVIVVADTDMLADRMWVQVQQFFGQQLLSPFANNGDFVVNSVDNYLGSSDLISIRGQATSRRPFTRIQELERAAEDRYRATEQQLEQELQETERKLSELQSGRQDGNLFILTEEQQAELERFREEKLRIRKELRAVQANLRADIDGLQTSIKAINILLVPMLLVVIAVFSVLTRRKKEANR